MILHSDVKYLIVQAGGLGTRMGDLTANKPKCLLPFQGTTIIQNIIRVFHDKNIIIIADYLSDVLKTYLKSFETAKNFRIVVTNESGTAAGLKTAAQSIPGDQPFVVCWSDLWFDEQPTYAFDGELLLGLTHDFHCRWRYHNGRFVSVVTRDRGVAGFYVFKNSQRFEQLTTDQSFVRGFLSKKFGSYETSVFDLTNVRDLGTRERYLDQLNTTSRFFNSVLINADTVTKTCVVPEYQNLIDDEIRWYNFIQNKAVRAPKILDSSKLTISRIFGDHAYNIQENREKLLKNHCDTLSQLHSIGTAPAVTEDCVSVYAAKIVQRVRTVKSLIANFTSEWFTINGRPCKNPLHNLNELYNLAYQAVPEKFTVIHGDPTFSNTLVDKNLDVWLIDPRGSFGNTKIFGDPKYDWAKLYYSAVGNYDSINRKQFSVKIRGHNVELNIQSQEYEHLADEILHRSQMSQSMMNFIHAGLWLSLSGYVREDVDAVLYSFFRGVELWNQI